MSAAAVPVLAAGGAGTVLSQEPPKENSAKGQNIRGVITRQTQPDNVEFPFATLASFMTPTEQFFVRNHFEVPKVEMKDWKLLVGGHVNKPVSFTYDSLRSLSSKTITALIECSGNSRVFLKPPQLGIRWEQGAVGTAEWTGVPLADVLERAGVKEGAVETIFEGADKGKYEPPDPKSPGEIHYARSLPLAKARQAEVLLAYQMNGKDLTAAHGFPVRLLVPGWYGMASVKWLQKIIVSDQPFHGFFQTFMYTIWRRPHGLPDLTPVTALQVKAQIARPMRGEVVPAGAKYRIFGAAWAGEADVSKVEVSSDGGKSWSTARLLEKAVPHAWRLFEYDWQTPERPGRYSLVARATDDQDRVQPLERDDDRRDAMINHVQRIEVVVE